MTAEGRHDWWQEEYPPTKRCVDAMDSTYGSRRDAVAPHKKRGARAPRTTSTVHAFWVVLEGDFCHFRQERGTSANIRQTTVGEALSLMYCPCLVCGQARGPRPLHRGPGQAALGVTDARLGGLRSTLRGRGL